MLIFLFVYTGFLSLFIVAGIHHYEAKVKGYQESIGDYKRALSIAKHPSNAEHYTYLQLENKRLNKELTEAYNSYSNMSELANQYRENWNAEHEAIHAELKNNDALKAQIKSMQEELGYLRNRAGSQEIQYESSTYKNNTWDSSKYEIFKEL